MMLVFLWMGSTYCHACRARGIAHVVPLTDKIPVQAVGQAKRRSHRGSPTRGPSRPSTGSPVLVAIARTGGHHHPVCALTYKDNADHRLSFITPMPTDRTATRL